jgi:ABC-type uncharacterized transport system permease subunit
MLEDRLSAAAAPRRSWGRFVLEVRLRVPPVEQGLIFGGAILAGLLLSAAILVAAGVPLAGLWDELVLDTILDPQNLRSVLFLAAPLAFVGLAAAMAFRVGFWNLGLEGQMIWGGIAATYLSIHQLGPDAMRLPLMLVAAAAAGVLWVMVAAFLKLRYGVNEIISTLLLGYIASYFLVYLLYGPWLDPRDGFPHSPPFAPYERLPDLAYGVSSAVPLALLTAALVAWLAYVSRAALYMRFIDANELAALAVGVPTRSVTLLAIGVSGALAALGGAVVLTGQEGRLTNSFYAGHGFSGILIAFLSRRHPFAVLVAAVLVAMLFVAGQDLQVFYQIPGSMVQVIEAVMVFCVAAAEFFLRHRLHWTR